MDRRRFLFLAPLAALAGKVLGRSRKDENSSESADAPKLHLQPLRP